MLRPQLNYSQPISTRQDGFTLPAAMLSKSAKTRRTAKPSSTTTSGISDKLSGLSLTQRRPNLTSSLSEQMSEEEHQAMIAKLAQRFEQRLRVSETKSKLVQKNIEMRRKIDDSMAAKPANATVSSTQKIVEKLRKKERDEIDRVLKETQAAQAAKKKVLIESLLPAKRRQYIQQLEQEVRQKQQRARDAYEAKLAKEERERLERERKRREAERIAAENAERARIAAENERKRKEEEAERKRKEDEAEAERKKAEAAAEAKRQAEAEAERVRKQQEEEEKRKKLEEAKEEAKNAPAELNEGDVPDLSASLLPPAALQSRKDKPYLQPCPELGAQMKKNVDAWTAFENDMKALSPADTLLDKDFFERYEDGKEEKILKTDEAIIRVANTITKYNANEATCTQDEQYQRYSDKLIHRIMSLNEQFAHKPNIVKFGIYKLVTGFAANKFVNVAKQKLPENRQQGLEQFLVDIYNRLHFQLPQLCLKEMVLGFFAQRNMLFYPQNAQIGDAQGNEMKLIEMRGFRLVGGKKESIEATIGRLQIHAVIFFSLQLSDAYIGRLFLMLSTLLALKHTQNQAGVILHLLEVAGSKLRATYGRAFTEQLRILQTEFCPSFRRHIQDPNGLKSEPQNQDKYLPAVPAGESADFGARETTLELDKLVRIVNEMLA